MHAMQARLYHERVPYFQDCRDSTCTVKHSTLLASILIECFMRIAIVPFRFERVHSLHHACRLSWMASWLPNP